MSFEEKLNREIRRANNNWSTYNEFSYKLTNPEIRQIFATRHEVNLLRDENGVCIPGTGREITAEEKKMVFDYILEKEYPLTRRIYNLILRGYLNGDIELSIKGPKL